MILSILKAVISKIFYSAYSCSLGRTFGLAEKIAWVKIIQTTPNFELLTACPHMVLLQPPKINASKSEHIFFLLSLPLPLILPLAVFVLWIFLSQNGNPLHRPACLNSIHIRITRLALNILGSWLCIHCPFNPRLGQTNMTWRNTAPSSRLTSDATAPGLVL